jgi:hypothetical protein
MSQKRMRAPCRANARALVVNVNDGTTTVSPGPRSSSIALSSSAEVQEVVSSTSEPVSSFRIEPTRLENGPNEELWPPSIDSRR